MSKYLTVGSYVLVLLVGLVAGQWVQAKLLTRPCTVTQCPDCKCPEAKPCPPQIDLSRLDLKKKGKNTVNINLYLNDTTQHK